MDNMDPISFSYWLQGFVELNEGKMPTPAQWKSICEHLQAVFNKVTPPVGKPQVSKETKETKKAPDFDHGKYDFEKIMKEWQKEADECRKYCAPSEYIWPTTTC